MVDGVFDGWFLGRVVHGRNAVADRELGADRALDVQAAKVEESIRPNALNAWLSSAASLRS